MGTKGPETVSTKLSRIAELARKYPDSALTTLAHHIDVDLLREAYRRVRKDGAPGVDGCTAKAYAEDLEAKLRVLLDRFKAGQYKAPPVKRVYIPKADGKRERPIGIPTIEDKILQRAVTMVLEAVYEQEFLDCSYGFRPGRSAHKALEELWRRLMDANGGWVIEADIQGFFDVLDHDRLREILDLRVRDGVIRRAIGKWLNAGVLEDGNISYPKSGTPQGGVISPMLANIYLHEVLDRWFASEVQPRVKWGAQLIRYADDFVIVCAKEEDARRVERALKGRLEKYGLKLSPEKTRVVDFRRPREGENRKPDTFDFLGFTHYWGSTRRGKRAVKRKTASKRLSRYLQSVGMYCKRHRHDPVREQHAHLCSSLRGFYNYAGITGNIRALQRALHETRRLWRKWLDRRSHSHPLTWDRFVKISRVYPLPPARLYHSSYQRHAANP